MIEFKEILEYCQVEAIANRMNPTEDSVWRGICREYSELFHTPLYLVLEMEPEHVVLNVYEKQIEEVDIEDYQKLEHIMDTILGIEDPNYDKDKRREQEEFDRQAELEDEKRIKAGRALHPSLQKNLPRKILSENEQSSEKKLPTGGSINLGYLAKQDSEG